MHVGVLDVHSFLEELVFGRFVVRWSLVIFLVFFIFFMVVVVVIFVFAVARS